MKRRLAFVLWSLACIFLVPSQGTAAEAPLAFQVNGQNPGGQGEYKGTVTLSPLSKSTARIRWVTGTNNEVTEGLAMQTDRIVGAAYGGDAFYAMAIYQIEGKTIQAKWISASKPAEVGSYTLIGDEYEGALPMNDGSGGSVTFTAQKGGVYRVAWDLGMGRFEGVGLRLGDVLVAVSGDPQKVFGVAAYEKKGNGASGIWSTNQGAVPGKETWVSVRAAQTADGAAPAAAGRTVEFAGQTYHLMENKSAPGAPTSELREYLQAGEDWAGYRKMVAFRLQNVKGADASTLAKATLEQVQKQHPGSFVNEIEMTGDAATILFILVVKGEVEFNLWNYRKTSAGVVSAQFVLRNKPPFETQKKFKAEQDRNYDTWLTEIKRLGGEAESLLAATSGVAVGAAAEGQKPEMNDAALAKAIKADLDKCAALALRFVEQMQGGNTSDAVALMSDLSFHRVSRAEWTQQLEKSNQVFGRLKKFVADRKATSFGVKEGVMTFTLQGDAEYEKALVRETFSFIRNEQGGVELTGYNRTAKGPAGE